MEMLSPSVRFDPETYKRQWWFEFLAAKIMKHNSYTFVHKASVQIGITTSSAEPYLEEDLVVANPAGNHVSSWHLPIRREAEPDISQRANLNFKRDIFCTGSPEHCVVGIQVY